MPLSSDPTGALGVTTRRGVPRGAFVPPRTHSLVHTGHPWLNSHKLATCYSRSLRLHGAQGYPGRARRSPNTGSGRGAQPRRPLHPRGGQESGVGGEGQLFQVRPPPPSPAAAGSRRPQAAALGHCAG